MKKIDYKNTPEYKAGLKVFLSKYEPSHLKLIDDMYDLSQALADTVVSHALYDIWERKTPLLSVREKEIATLASLVSAGVVHSEIKAHIDPSI